MQCDWVFLKKDSSKVEATLEGPIPEIGDGKWHEDVGYVVRHIVTGRTTTPNAAIIAIEDLENGAK